MARVETNFLKRCGEVGHYRTSPPSGPKVLFSLDNNVLRFMPSNTKVELDQNWGAIPTVPPEPKATKCHTDRTDRGSAPLGVMRCVISFVQLLPLLLSSPGLRKLQFRKGGGPSLEVRGTNRPHPKP